MSLVMRTLLGLLISVKICNDLRCAMNAIVSNTSEMCARWCACCAAWLISDMERASCCDRFCSTKHVWQAKVTVIRRCSTAKIVSGCIGQQQVKQRQVYRSDMAHTAVKLGITCVSHGCHMDITSRLVMGHHTAVMPRFGLHWCYCKNEASDHSCAHSCRLAATCMHITFTTLQSWLLTTVNMQAQCWHTGKSYIILWLQLSSLPWLHSVQHEQQLCRLG